ncbi:hypothetical protein KUF71_006055 [Frankliniella fusca]|uniref:Uncharacterized protein n=1 Tax=Frankliniella fusca TaxID=407009 RepID=A0AAE1H727_9NEOP|nr:hypothetical protein KUF71_006055 [Frankliniella fusca]
MALVHNSSSYALHSALDCFGVHPTNVSLDNGYHVVVYPISSVDDAPTIELVSASGDEYIDPAHTLVFVQGKIAKADGSDLSATDSPDVAPVNYLLHTMWKQVDVELNGTLVSQASTNYHYRSYMEACLGYDFPAKKSHLTSLMWYKDDANAMDSLTANSGLTARRAIAEKGKTFEMIGALHGDI